MFRVFVLFRFVCLVGWLIVWGFFVWILGGFGGDFFMLHCYLFGVLEKPSGKKLYIFVFRVEDSFFPSASAPSEEYLH